MPVPALFQCVFSTTDGSVSGKKWVKHLIRDNKSQLTQNYRNLQLSINPYHTVWLKFSQAAK